MNCEKTWLDSGYIWNMKQLEGDRTHRWEIGISPGQRESSRQSFLVHLPVLNDFLRLYPHLKVDFFDKKNHQETNVAQTLYA